MGFKVLSGGEVLSDNYVNVPDRLKSPISVGDENRVTFWHLEEATGFMTIAETHLEDEAFEFYTSTLLAETKSGDGRQARPPKDLFTDYEYSFETGDLALFISTPDIEAGATYLITLEHLNDLFGRIFSVYMDNDEPDSRIIADAMEEVREKRESGELGEVHGEIKGFLRSFDEIEGRDRVEYLIGTYDERIPLSEIAAAMLEQFGYIPDDEDMQKLYRLCGELDKL